MKLYSTNNNANIVDLKEAVLNAYPKDRGLYMPSSINPLPISFFENINQYSLIDIAFIVSQNLIGDYISEKDLYSIVSKAMNFPAPVKVLNEKISTLELFHGPSMAFKDFGARFMAELMSFFLKDENRNTTILVATSGDTGGAVAAGFYGVEGIDVYILYPSGKVSPLQEKQLTTWGKNIKAIEVDGVFDDCQALVKEAFLDDDLKNKYTFSSANSINIARLIPQSFYYFEGYKQVKDLSENIVFSIPSGNFGNLTAGLLAKRMGLPVKHFLAATNVNDTVPDFLSTGEYKPKVSVPTISNAMDVGSPSNFSRMKELYSNGSSTWNNMKKDILGFSYDDERTASAIIEINKKLNYTPDPHGAVAYLAAKDYLHKHSNSHCVFLETAHPGKFSEVVNQTLETEIVLPDNLKSFLNNKKQAYSCQPTYRAFKKLMLDL